MNRISKNFTNGNVSNMSKVQRYLCITSAQSRSYKSDCDTAAALGILFAEETHSASYGEAVSIFIGMLVRSRGVPQWYADAYRKACWERELFQHPSWQQVLFMGLRLSRFDDYEF